MIGNLLGNPHSASASSQLSSQRIDHVRLKVLSLFNASPDHFDVVFVANATAGIKLVVDAFSGLSGGFWFGYHKDSHTSIMGARELASRGSQCFSSDHDVESWLSREDYDPGARLFAYPAQSNMNGRRLPLHWCSHLRNSARRNVYSLLDAAALVSTSPLDLSDYVHAPDFTVLSFYKIFGFPDLGALIVRKASGDVFQHRKYFGGGTVDVVTCLDQKWHMMREGAMHNRLEDGTLPVHSIIALDCAISVHERLYGGLEQISAHTSILIQSLCKRLKSFKHSNGRPVCEIYKDPLSCYSDRRTQGPIVAFNLRDSRGYWISSHELQKYTAVKNIHLRTGSLCNPGGVASSLGLSSQDLSKSYIRGFRCGDANDVVDGRPMGMIRVSLGAMNTMDDVDTFIDFIDEFFVDKTPTHLVKPCPPAAHEQFYVESLTVYPIKSCGGWEIPSYMPWAIRPEGLAWDREWCLIHQGTRAALSQKRYPKMALFKPTLDLEASQLHIRYIGPKPSRKLPREISIPLSSDLSHSMELESRHDDDACPTTICGDKIQPLIYHSAAITSFFSEHLHVPVYLARFPSTHLKSCPRRQVKAMSAPVAIKNGVSEPFIDEIPGAFPTPPPSPPPRPLLFSNESPILVISRSSINQLNKTIEETGGQRVEATAFRANIILAQAQATENKEPHTSETPYIEDAWNSIRFFRHQGTPQTTIPPTSPLEATTPYTQLEILGPCQRCQMVCVNQDTGEKSREPFTTLAKTRRWSGGVWFGVHAGLAITGAGSEGLGESSIRVGDWVSAE